MARPLKNFPPAAPAAQAAFAEAVPTLWPRLMRVAVTILRDRRVANVRDMAEDIVQTTLYQAFRKLDDFRGDCTLTTWVITICRNEAGQWVRHEKHLTMAQPPTFIPMDRLGPAALRELEKEISL